MQNHTVIVNLIQNKQLVVHQTIIKRNTFWPFSKWPLTSLWNIMSVCCLVSSVFWSVRLVGQNFLTGRKFNTSWLVHLAAHICTKRQLKKFPQPNNWQVSGEMCKNHTLLAPRWKRLVTRRLLRRAWQVQKRGRRSWRYGSGRRLERLRTGRRLGTGWRIRCTRQVQRQRKPRKYKLLIYNNCIGVTWHEKVYICKCEGKGDLTSNSRKKI